MSVYCDSNLFIFATERPDAKGDAARTELERALQDGACTSSLTLDEVLRSLSKTSGRAGACDKVALMLQLDLEVLDVRRVDIEDAIHHVRAGFDPRDAIHAAVALRHKCTSIVSSDPAFRKLKGIKHIPF